MQTLQELYNKQERVIQLNNAIFDELERRGDFSSSHWRIQPFIDNIMEAMYSIQNEYILPYFEATGQDVFKWLVLKLDNIKTSDGGYFESMDYILESKLDDIILEYESIQDDIDNFYYQLAKV
jgi:hypothetical protein